MKKLLVGFLLFLTSVAFATTTETITMPESDFNTTEFTMNWVIDNFGSESENADNLIQMRTVATDWKADIVTAELSVYGVDTFNVEFEIKKGKVLITYDTEDTIPESIISWFLVTYFNDFSDKLSEHLRE